MSQDIGHTVDTLVVLIAVFWAGASACSFINEIIAGAVQARGNTLYRGLVDLVCGARDFVDDLYRHPLIYSSPSTVTPPYGAATNFWSFLGAESNWPSYIDARSFSDAFWQTLQNNVAVQSGEAVAVGTAVATTPPQLLADLRTRVAAIDPKTPGIGALTKTLASFLAEAGDDYERLLSLTDDWFNRQMDRISGWYRRMAQWILLAFALLFAFGLNIDTIHIVAFFQTETAIASQLSENIAASYGSAKTASSTQSQPGAQGASALDQALSTEDLPLAVFLNPAARRSPTSILGDLITAIAFAMGAPFWFDLLGKVINVRMAGAKPDPTGNQTTQ